MIYLLRHGLDDERYIGGWSDIGLICEGIKQIEGSTKYIVDKMLVINKIYCSDIKRAKETAFIVNKKLNLDIVYTSDLRELDKGDFTGIVKEKLNCNDIEKISSLSINDRYPNGEAMIDLYNRIKNYVEKLEKFDDVLLVTHRGVINMFYYILNNIELDMDKEKFNVDHGSIHEMDLIKKKIRRIY